MIRRREIITLLGGAAAWPVAARAQRPATPMVGFLRSTAATGSMHLVTAFRHGLSEVGFNEGRNVAIEYRWADDDNGRLPELARDLVGRKAAVIIGNSVAAVAAKAIATTTPIVFVQGNDPVRSGLVTSLNRPGGNVTGVVFTSNDLAGKQLGLLHELVPKATIMAVLIDPRAVDFEDRLRDVEAAGHTIGRKIPIVKAASEREFSGAFATMVEARIDALLNLGGPLYVTHRRQLVLLAARYRLPAGYVARDWPDVGGLMSYGPSQSDAYRRAGVYAGRILKGEKPADLPVEQATKFELIVNLAAAKAIGLDIPPMLLARADEVIE